MNLRPRATRSLSVTTVALVCGCAQVPPTLPGPVSYPRSPASSGLNIGSENTQRPTEMAVSTLPQVPGVGTGQGATVDGATTRLSAADGKEEVSMAIEQTPLPTFIQILYGNVLKRAYSVDQTINTRTDIVTFKTSRPIPKSQLEDVAVNLLRSYQIAVQDFGGVVRIVPDNSPAASPPPLLRRGKTLPETPEALRPAFQHVELDVVRASDVSNWIKQIMGQRVVVTDDPVRNGFLLAGTQADLRIALDLIQSFDQPRLRGRVVRRVTPAFLNATEFSARLNDVLTAQGYAVSTTASNASPVLLVPIPAIGSVVVFANTEEVMAQVLRWGRELDKPLPAQTQNGLFTYAVKYADAQELAKTLGDILLGTNSQGAAPAPAPAPAPAAGLAAGGAPTPAVSVRAGGRVVVNSATNTLIIRGTNAEENQQIMALLRELDRPVKSAMIEVVVAELTLGGSQALGVEWQLTPQSAGSGTIVGGTLGRLGIGSSGITLGYANSAGQVLGLLNALASNNKARILSNPKVLARNGETASIQVGSEVPIITSQQSAGTGGLFGNTGGILQSVQYRSTGVILRVRPVINSGNRLDLDVSQEVSSAAETRTGVAASPTISTRRLETKLSLRDGSTAVLGGLISRNTSDANTGVPFLKDIPGLGSLFRTESGSNNQTELLIMITPYVISDDFESEAISEAIQKSFGEWAQDIKPARVVPVAPSEPPMITPRLAPPPDPMAPVAPGPSSPLLPAPVPAPASAGGTPAAGNVPGAAPATAPRDSGITMSRPDGSIGPATAPAPAPAMPPGAMPGTTVQPPATAASGAAPARPAGTPVPPGGRVVEDPKIKKEIEDLLNKRKP